MDSSALAFSRPSSPFEEIFATNREYSNGFSTADYLAREEPDIPQKGLVKKYDKMFSDDAFDYRVRWTHHLRQRYPNMILTVIPANNVLLIAFASAGNAKAKLDTESEGYHRIRGWAQGYTPGSKGSIAEAVTFGRYKYVWLSEEFTIYFLQVGFSSYYFVLKEPEEGESVNGYSSVTDKLIEEVAKWQTPKDENIVYEFDMRWMASKALWQEVAKAKWEDVILDKQMKKELQEIATRFFDSKEIYDGLGVPWKRGIIFHGPAGNGKTISIKALMHTLYDRKKPIPSLYVKAVRNTYEMRVIFSFARVMAPCLLILEDIDTIVNGSNRSYFFNEVDGLANNNGIMTIATTNHLEWLDPGLSQRPSRFDRKYLFPLPTEDERALYCQFWRTKIQNLKSPPDFPEKLCAAIASITDRFTFAYLQEAFVATLLAIARKRLDEGLMDNVDDDNDFEQYELWREMVKTVKVLRKEMGGQSAGKPLITKLLEPDVDKRFWTPDKTTTQSARISSPVDLVSYNKTFLNDLGLNNPPSPHDLSDYRASFKPQSLSPMPSIPTLPPLPPLRPVFPESSKSRDLGGIIPQREQRKRFSEFAFSSSTGLPMRFEEDPHSRSGETFGFPSLSRFN